MKGASKFKSNIPIALQMKQSSSCKSNPVIIYGWNYCLVPCQIPIISLRMKRASYFKSNPAISLQIKRASKFKSNLPIALQMKQASSFKYNPVIIYGWNYCLVSCQIPTISLRMERASHFKSNPFVSQRMELLS